MLQTMLKVIAGMMLEIIELSLQLEELQPSKIGLKTLKLTKLITVVMAAKFTAASEISTKTFQIICLPVHIP
jgi:hypothetical protein